VNLRAFFHVYLPGRWQAPLAEHLDALDASGYWKAGHGITFGLIGMQSRRAAELVLGDALFDRETQPGDYQTVWRAEGNEQLTLAAAQRYAQKHDGAVLYAHTKGAANPRPLADAWRRSMTERVVRRWRENLQAIESGDVDMVGTHWLTQEEFGSALVALPYWGGNFWMATCEYLRTLPPVNEATSDRYTAEVWVGSGPVRPRVLDLRPGWPSFTDEEMMA
jgi:glyoxylase-like metal-dependent hydrolase (beta-lactamase superfamily II)